MGLGWPLPEGSKETRKEMGRDLPESLLCPNSGLSTDTFLPLRTPFLFGTPFLCTGEAAEVGRHLAHSFLCFWCFIQNQSRPLLMTLDGEICVGQQCLLLPGVTHCPDTPGATDTPLLRGRAGTKRSSTRAGFWSASQVYNGGCHLAIRAAVIRKAA